MGVFKKGNAWWIDYYNESGERKRKKVGSSKKVAKDTLEEVRTQVRQKKLGIVQHSHSSKPVLINDFFDECLDYFNTNLSQKTAKRYRAVLKHFSYFLHGFPKVKLLSQLRPQHFEKYKTYRKSVPLPKGLSYFDKPAEDIEELLLKAERDGNGAAKDNTVNFEVQILKTMFKHAVTWKYLSENPARPVKFLRVTDAKKPRFLSKDEMAELLNSATGEFRLALQTFLLTGMRSGELVNLEWSDIDFRTATIHLRNKESWQPKHGHERSIPIHSTLLPFLKKHKKQYKQRNSFVFCNDNNNQFTEDKLRTRLCKLTKKCKFPDVTKVHSLRHTFGSQLVLNGVDLPTVSDLMGHKDIETTMIYVHRTPDHLVKSVNRLGI